jgi:hypothetical protein
MKTLEQMLTDETLQDIRAVIMDDDMLKLQYKNNQVIACSDYVWKELNAITDDVTSVTQNIQSMATSLLARVIRNRQAALPMGSIHEIEFSVVMICEKATMNRTYKAIAKMLNFSETWKEVTSLIFIGQHETLETLAPPQSEDQTTETKEI